MVLGLRAHIQKEQKWQDYKFTLPGQKKSTRPSKFLGATVCGDNTSFEKIAKPFEEALFKYFVEELIRTNQENPTVVLRILRNSSLAKFYFPDQIEALEARLQRMINAPDENQQSKKQPPSVSLFQLRNKLNAIAMGGAFGGASLASLRAASLIFASRGGPSFEGAVDHALLLGVAGCHALSATVRITYGINRGLPPASLSGLTAIGFASMELIEAVQSLTGFHPLPEASLEATIRGLITWTVASVGVAYADAKKPDQAAAKGETPKPLKLLGIQIPIQMDMTPLLNERFGKGLRSRKLPAWLVMGQYPWHIFQKLLYCQYTFAWMPVELVKALPELINSGHWSYEGEPDLRYPAAALFLDLLALHACGVESPLLDIGQIAAACTMNLEHVRAGSDYWTRGKKGEGAAEAEIAAGLVRGGAEAFLHSSNPALREIASMLYQAGKAGIDVKALLAQLASLKRTRP